MDVKKCVAAVFVLAGFSLALVNAAQTETFDVATFITSRFAETTITSQVKNNQSSNQEIKFQFLLPKEAFISAFSLTINGITYDAIVEEKVKAEKAFQAAKQLNKTAGLVSTRKESTKTFKTSVNVAAGETVEFKLVYQQLLRRIRGKYKHQIILLGSQLTDILTMNVFICESQRITNVTVPPILTSEAKRITPNVMINREQNSAHVEYLQGENDEMVTNLASSGGSFELEYELEPTVEAGQIVINNGYFAYFYAPDVKIDPRRIVFTLDLSGSMFGDKLAQMKEAMINIIDKLTEDDHFTIVTFASSAMVWKGLAEVHPATRETIKEAQDFIRAMHATGGTNINAALTTALRILHSGMERGVTYDPKSNYVVFLTDGQPTEGITDTGAILNNIDASNARNLSIHSIGFGSGVDTGFLKSVAARNQGTWTQVLHDINAALQIQNYLDELSVSLLKDIVIDYPADVVDQFILQPEDQFRAGGELIAFGRFKDDIDPRNRGPHLMEISGKSGGQVQLQLEFYLDQKEPTCTAVAGNVVHDFGNKAFGLTSVVEVLRRYDAETDDVLKEELKEKAINMSISYGLVTPVTSMLVIKPGDKKAIEDKLAEKPKAPKAKPTATAAPPSPPRTSTVGVPPWGFQGDPHFVIKMTDEVTVCFNWMGRDGEIFNLLHDPEKSVVINGLVEGADTKPGVDHAIYITKLVVLLGEEHLRITIDPREVVVSDTSNSKRGRDLRLPMVNIENYEAKYGHVTFRISDANAAHTILNVTVAAGISFIVNLHHYTHYKPGEIDHLDLMISGSEKFSQNVGGIFGRFPRPNQRNAAASIETSGTKTLLWYNDAVTSVKRTAMFVPYVQKKVDCWFVPKPSAILGASLKSFKVQSLTAVPKIVASNR